MIARQLGVLATLAAFMLAACSDGGEPASRSADAEPSPDSEAPSASEKSLPAAAPAPTKADDFEWPVATARAVISTSMGDITVELYGEEAPQTVENFLQYAADGHYDRTIIHRVVAGFVIQGGGYSQLLTERPTRDPIAYEGDNGLPNYRTTLAMARTSDPDSAAAQWYINLADNNDDLDHFENDLGVRHGYAVFGRVVDGMAVADEIGAVATGPRGPFDAEVPVEPVFILGVAAENSEQ